MKPMRLILALFIVFVLVGCESEPPSAMRVSTPEPITLRQFETPEATLDETLMVELDDGDSLNVSINWETSLETFDTSEVGTFEIEGTLESDAFLNPENIKALQTVTIEAATVEEALDYSDATHFKTMYETFDHPDKDTANTLFVPSDGAIQEILDFLEMDLETLMNQDAFEALMLDHMSEETISKNRLETNVPGVYTTLRDKELIVEGSEGSPLIDSEYTLLASHDLVERHVHYIDGVILSEDTLSMVGADVFDDEMGERLLEILRDQGFITDILLGRKFTLFMPDQDALIAYAQSEGLSLSTLLESTEFETLIMGHVIRDEYSAETLYTDAPMSLEAVNGETINISVSEGDLYANNAMVTNTETIEQVGTLLTIDSIIEFPSE